jgi:hypothetical protein
LAKNQPAGVKRGSGKMRNEIKKEIEEEKKDSDIFFSDEIIMRGKQKFVSFEGLANQNTVYDITKNIMEIESVGGTYKYFLGIVAIKFDGKYVLKRNEWETKILCCMISNRKGKKLKHLSWQSMGWLYKSELKLSNEEISRNVSEHLEDNFSTTPAAML